MTVDPRHAEPRSLREYNALFNELSQMRADGRIHPVEYRRLRARSLDNLARPEMQTRLVDDAPTEDGHHNAFNRTQPPNLARPAKPSQNKGRGVIGVAIGALLVVVAILAVLAWKGGA
jgi:hypothetical protein